MSIKKLKVFFTTLFLFSVYLFFYKDALAGLSCSVTTTCNSPSVVLLKMSGTSNAHAELATQSNYSNLLCCTGLMGLGNSCSGNFDTVAKLSSTTNAHVEQKTQTNYLNSACISVNTGTISTSYQSTNCDGHDATLASISAVTNAQIGNASAYTTKICADANVPQSLSFSISDNTIGFGPLTSAAARFATGDNLGSATQIEAHTLVASTNAFSGYNISVKGDSLNYSGNFIAAIGGTNTASSPGTEQFGLRMVASGGSGAVTSPYNGFGFAYDADANNSSQVASASVGDSTATTYSVRYVSNVSADTLAGEYQTTLTYSVTSNF